MPETARIQSMVMADGGKGQMQGKVDDGLRVDYVVRIGLRVHGEAEVLYIAPAVGTDPHCGAELRWAALAGV